MYIQEHEKDAHTIKHLESQAESMLKVIKSQSDSIRKLEENQEALKAGLEYRGIYIKNFTHQTK